ncbi:putative sucrose-phosphatase 2 [Citrus sinensis]|uniref:Sucrose-phosphatase 2 n=1 Tax=Citrus sinensis TaxID=2711 RepID=A0ACB8JZ89_CITSI|nr:putative sucrose-phosphatase 2 [Citrus sinensis]
MDRLSAAARLMIVSDLDHTMVDHHDAENLSLLRFNALWEAHYRRDSLLVFSTGRSPTLYKQLRKEKPMLTPDITIMSVGTEITYGDAMVPDNGWVEVLNQKWDKKIVTEEASRFPELKLQSETEQRPHKVSFYVDKDKAQTVTQKLSEIFKNRGVLARDKLLHIYSGSLRVREKYQLTLLSVVILEMMPNYSAFLKFMDNAQEELLQWHAANAKNNPKITHATERCAAGIIQAIGHFKLGPSTSPRDIKDESDGEVKSIDLGHEVVKLYLFYERWRRAEIDNSEIYLSSLKANCCPSGFCVPPSGGEISLAEAINQFRKCYGDKQGKQFRVWVDRVLSTEIGPGTWLVKFHKWELSGEERACSIVSIIVRIKDTSDHTYMHVHETWLEGFGANDGRFWI